MSQRRHPLRLFTFLGAVFLFLCSHSGARAQIQWEPATSGFSTELRVWTSGGTTYAKARLTFPNSGWRVADWGQVTRSGNEFTADAKVERCLCGSAQVITYAENNYSLGALAPGSYSFTFKSYGTVIKTQQFDPAQVVEHWEPATGVRPAFRVATYGGTVTPRVEFYFPDNGYAVTDWGQVTRSGNSFTVDIKADRWTGDSRVGTVLVYHDYPLGPLPGGTYTFTAKVYGTVANSVSFNVTAQPKLLTEDDSNRALALDSVTWMRLFPLVTTLNFSQDRRARVMLFMTGVELQPNESSSVVTAQAEDASHNIYTLGVEYVGKVPGYDWLTQVIVRPPDELRDAGDVSVTVSVRGIASNTAVVSFKPSASQ